MRNIRQKLGLAFVYNVAGIAIAESLDGETVEWMEPVSEADYRRPPSP